MKRTLRSILLLAAVAAFALPAVAADLEAPVCSDAAALSRAAAAPALAKAPISGELAPGTDLGVAAEPLPMGVPAPVPPIEPEQCGLVTCPAGTRCCNPLCSACTPPGVYCTMGDCGHGPTS